MGAAVLRTVQVNVRLNESEEAWLDRLAEHFSVSPATVVRLLVKAKHDELWPAESKAAPKPRKR
jgi:hypothetical protein